MTFKRHWMITFIITIFFIVIYLLSLNPLFEYDIWFHIKSGEIVAKEGIIFHDVFSHAAPNRPWYPYEWLFQIGVYYIEQWFGLSALQLVTAGLSTILIGLFFVILRYILVLPISLILIVTFGFYVLIYDFLLARPHLPAMVLFLSELFIILSYVVKKKHLLWLTIPLTLIWANMHASVIFAPLLFFGYAGMALVVSQLNKEPARYKQVLTLVLWGVITTILTVLPPIGFTQYRLLGLFIEHRSLITKFIDEWIPLSAAPLDFTPLIVTSLFAGLISLYCVIRRLGFKKGIWLLPLFPFLAGSFLAVRNLLWAYLTLVLVFAWGIGELYKYPKLRIALWSLCAMVLVASTWLIWQKKQPERMYVPDNAVKFLKSHHINGNIFNGMGVGGYLLYHLYPEYRVFIDGRADVYFCCEIPDMVAFLDKKFLPDDAWKKELDTLFAKYDISFVLHTTKRQTVSRRIGEILQHDPLWSLVYWGDDFQILVKRDGKNDAIIEEFGVHAATPLELTPYKIGMEEVALSEYERMITIADSARSRNAIGVIYMGKSRFEEAREQFTRAIAIEPLFDSPYMNLGELAFADGDFQKAITLYEKAIQIAVNRGFTYIRLGDIYKEIGDTTAARSVWEQGLAAPVSTESKDMLRKRLSGL